MVTRRSACWIVVVLTLGVSATATAQERAGSIRGVVYDKDFEVPVASAQVTVVETEAKLQTSDQGDFVFGQLPPGQYTLVFAKSGYVRQIRSGVVVEAGQLTEIDVWLAGDITEMEEFVVQGMPRLGAGSEESLLRLRFDSPSLMDSISAEMMSQAGASDAASALTLVSGASVKDGKSAVIRGLPDRYVSSQLNGIRLPSADEDKRAVELDQFPAAVIESVRVTKTFTPDQQGDASGGAVDVRLKGVPDEPFFFRFKSQVGYNSNVRQRGDFLTYDGGGVTSWGRGNGRRGIQYDNLGSSWDGAVGVSRGSAPIDHKWSTAIGGKQDIGSGWKLGGSGSFFYERDSAFYDDGVDDSFWVTTPGEGMTPQTSQGTPEEGDFKTALFDVTQGSESVQWGGLATFGVEHEDHALNFVYLYTRTAEDKATLAEDTRGKKYYFPAYDPTDPSTPGHVESDAAPYLRLETLEYTERTTETAQISGRHTLRIWDGEVFRPPELDWSYARSSARLVQPDKRQFGSLWLPGREVSGFTIPPSHRPFKPAANFTLGNLQRTWKTIDEESDQYAVNLRLPFKQWSDSEGALKFGFFSDQVDRKFDQDSFSNFGDNSSFNGEWNEFWSGEFPFENHPITASDADVDYTGELDVSAYYAMIELPLISSLSLVGGARFEDTKIRVINDPEEDATWFPRGSQIPTELNPGDADVDFSQDDVLPAIGLTFRPWDEITLRASYSETVARPTFKELTPILQQEFLGGPIFIGNPEVEMSSLKNYDLRLDYTPYEGGLFSVSWFKKDIDKPIEYVQKLVSFTYTTAENYPKGEINGWEFEVRQSIGHFWDALEGFSVGANATLIDSEVTLSGEEQEQFNLPGIQAPMTTRDMTNAPEHLYNLYLTYDLQATGTRLGLFYTVQGDTLITGAGQSDGNFVPSIYAREFGTLNLSVSQSLGDFVNLQFRAKNLTDPRIRTIYRSQYIPEDVTRSSFTRGIDYSISIGGELTF